MDISLTSDYNAEDIKNFIDMFTEEYNKDEVRLRKILEKGRATLNKRKEEPIQISLNELEKEIKIIFGDAEAFKKDYISDSFYLKLSKRYIPIIDEETVYEFNINFATGRVHFNIEPETIILSLDDFPDGSTEDDLNENKPDENEIYGIAKEIKELKDLTETEKKLTQLELELDQYKEKIQKELEKDKQELSSLEQFLTAHKDKVLSIDYILRRFARANSFEYITNHSFSIPENKDQLKLVYAHSQ